MADEQNGISDSFLIVQVKKGNEAAFRKIYDKYSEKLYYFAFRYLQNEFDSQEIVQEIFTKIWVNREDLNENLSFNSYLFTIAKNTILNINRKRVNQQAYLDYMKNHISGSSVSTEETVYYNDIKRLIDAGVDSLPPQRKLIFKLSREQNLSNKEIAEKLNISARTVETHIQLALKQLRKLLDNQVVTVAVAIALYAFL